MLLLNYKDGLRGRNFGNYKNSLELVGKLLEFEPFKLKKTYTCKRANITCERTFSFMNKNRDSYRTSFY